MDNLARDLRSALRQWGRTPLVTLVTLLSLVVGVGASLTLFRVVNALVFARLPVANPHELVRIVTTHGDAMVSYRVWEEFRAAQPVLADVFAASTERFNLARGGEARIVTGAFVSGNYFDTLGVGAARGRMLAPLDDTLGAAPVAVITDGLWRRELNGAPDIVGRSIWVDNQPFEIVGVTSRRFFGLEVGRSMDVLLPIAAERLLRGTDSRLTQPRASWLQIFGRLQPGRSREESSAALLAWQPALREATRPEGVDVAQHLPYPLGLADTAHGYSFLRRQYGDALVYLFAAVTFVLLIVCVNLASLVLARFSDRGRELAVRTALGANRRRLVQTLLTESIAIAAVGAGLGLLVSHWLTPILSRQLVMPLLRGVAPALDTGVDHLLIAITIALAVTSGIVTGLVPALRASATDPLSALSSGTRDTRRGTPLVMRAIVACQIAVSLMLMAGAALLVRSFVGLATQPSGLDADRVLVADVSGPLGGSNQTATFARLSDIASRLRGVPGVQTVSAASVTPLSGAIAAAPLYVPGSRANAAAGASLTFNRVLPGFFDTVGTPLIAGRDFTDADVAGAAGVLIVNQEFAARHFPRGSALGKLVTAGQRQMYIVGVVGDARQMSLREARPVPMAYGPMAQWMPTANFPRLRYVLRADQPDRLRAGIVAALRDVDSSFNVEFTTLANDAMLTVQRERLLAWLGGLAALLGSVIAIAGLYGTFMYAVTRRRAEIGVRMALGAERRDVVRLILGDAGVVLAAGLGLGIAGTLAAGRMVESLLFNLSPRDPSTLAFAVSALTCAALLASYLPARRAATVDPAAVLRDV